MSSYVITGGSGFIGSNLGRRLVADGHEVTIVDNLSTGRRENLFDIEDRIRFVEGDIRCQETLAPLLEGVDCIFHQAALPSVSRSVADPWSSNDHNVNGTLNVLLSARDARVRRVVYAASSSAYGDTEELPKRESMTPSPRSPYAVTKFIGELYCSVFHRVYGLETVALRYFNVFGPNQNPASQYAAVIPLFVSKLLAGEPPTILGDGNQTRDFTYVDNVVAANLAAANAPSSAAGGVYNIGCGSRISLNSLLDEIQRILDIHIPPTYAPPRPGDIRDSQADLTAAKSAIGYVPIVPIREGLRRTIEWMRTLAKSC